MGAGVFDILQVIQTDSRGFQEIFYRTAGGLELEHCLMTPGAITRPHVRHENAEDTITFTEQGLDRSPQSMTDIRGRWIVIEGARMTVMDDDQFTVGMLR